MQEFTSQFKEIFPLLYDKQLLEKIEENSQQVNVKAGERIIDIGDYIKSVPLVIEGSIKIIREDNDGNELFLYYINKGGTCAMSLTCCISAIESSIRAVAEEDTTFYAIPVRFMDEWMKEFQSWKTFVMNTYRTRFEELLLTIDSIAFTKLDQRLEDYIAKKCKINNSKIIQATHQEIAYELHSSREVISRLLKQLERKGKIKLSRNKIKLLM